MVEYEWDDDQQQIKLSEQLSPLARYKKELKIETRVIHGRWTAIIQSADKVSMAASAATEIKAINHVARLANQPTFDEWRLEHGESCTQ